MDNLKNLDNISDINLNDNIEEDLEDKNYSGTIYKYKVENDNIHNYLFQRNIGDKIDLRYKDRKCQGIASINKNDIITFKTKVILNILIVII